MHVSSLPTSIDGSHTHGWWLTEYDTSTLEPSWLLSQINIGESLTANPKDFRCLPRGSLGSIATGAEVLELDKVRSCSSSLLSAALPFTSCLLRPSSSLSESARGPAPTKFLRDKQNAPPRVRNLLHEPNLPSFRLPKNTLLIDCAGACECNCVEQKAVGAKEPIESDKLQHSSRAAVKASSKTMGVRDERDTHDTL